LISTFHLISLSTAGANQSYLSYNI